MATQHNSPKGPLLFDNFTPPKTFMSQESTAPDGPLLFDGFPDWQDAGLAEKIAIIWLCLMCLSPVIGIVALVVAAIVGV